MTLDELHVRGGGRPELFTPAETLEYNLRRVADDGLSDGDRIASLSVVLTVGGRRTIVSTRLADMLASPGGSPVVRQVLLHVLAQRDYPDLAPHVAMALPTTEPGRLQQALLDWLTRHRQPKLLAAIVRLWAAADPTDEAGENRYRRLVETTAGRTWSDVLADGLNRPSFLAKGSALGLLANRLSGEQLRRRLLAIEPESVAVEALQFYCQRLDYIPDRGDLLAAVTAFCHRRDLLEQAIPLADRWRAESGYVFDVGDLHLLSRVGSDPNRSIRPREKLLASLADRLNRRTYGWTAGVAGPAGGGDPTSVLASLSVADLLRLDLLCEMLGSPHTRRLLRTTARRDRDDRTSQWGGLIVYLDGHAQGRLYLPGAAGDDQAYRPNERMVQEAADCVTMFHCRFDRAYRGSDLGPTEADFDRLRSLSVRGVILTAISEDHFAAVFYTPDGVVIPLGAFQFLQ